jgi:hypothetical protein
MAMQAPSSTITGSISQELSLESGDGIVGMTFDLQGVAMTKEQEAIVLKLFRQSPTAVLSDGQHRHDREAGKEGPASQYLTVDDFEAIRRLGVRLGTHGDLVALACDFCLHCVKLEALPNWEGGFR